jgi:hypothetical protein
MAENKTKPIKDEQKRKDSFVILEIMKKQPGRAGIMGQLNYRLWY